MRGAQPGDSLMMLSMAGLSKSPSIASKQTSSADEHAPTFPSAQVEAFRIAGKLV